MPETSKDPEAPPRPPRKQTPLILTAPTAPTVLAALILALLSTSAAADTDAEWFGAVKTSIGEVTIDSIRARGIGTGTIIDGMVDGAIEDDEVDDYTAGVGFAVGRRFGYWHIAAEYVWRYRTDWDIVAPTPSIQAVTNVFANVETSSLLLNLARRGPINEHWSWELGAGIGWVTNDIDAEFIEREVPGVRPEFKVKDSSSTSDFSYNVFGGVTRELGGPWTLNLRARYIDLGELESGPFPSRAVRTSADHESIEVQFSLERDF